MSWILTQPQLLLDLLFKWWLSPRDKVARAGQQDFGQNLLNIGFPSLSPASLSQDFGQQDIVNVQNLLSFSSTPLLILSHDISNLVASFNQIKFSLLTP